MTSDALTMGRLEAAPKVEIATREKLGEGAELANQQLQFNREAMAALPNAEVGPMSEWLTHSRGYLMELGVPKGLIPGSGTVTPTTVLNKELKNAALQGARSLYGTRMTQNEVKLQTEEMSPSPSMMRDAIASLAQQNNIRSMYAVQKNDDFQEYQKRGGDASKFENWYNTHRPLTRFATVQSIPHEQLSAAMQRLSQLQQTPKGPQALADFKDRYGFDPTD